MSDLESIVANHEPASAAAAVSVAAPGITKPLVASPDSVAPSAALQEPGTTPRPIDRLNSILAEFFPLGIRVAAIDGRIRVRDPNHRLTEDLRTRFKAVVHDVWPDGRYD